VSCVEERIDADLRLGRHADVVGELEGLVEEHPLRERLRALLMVALSRSGRQAEALECYAAGRQALADELGMEPGAALRDLERRILEQDPALAADAPATERAPALAEDAPPTGPAPAPARHPRGARSLVVAGVAILAMATGAGFLLSSRGGGAGSAVPGDSVIAIDARSGRAKSPVDVGGRPSHLAVTEGAVWTGDASGGAVKRIDPAKGTVIQSIALGAPPAGLAAGAGAVWATDGFAGQLVRIGPDTNAIVQRIRVPAGPRGVAVGAGAVWVASRYAYTVTKVDARTGRRYWSARVGGSPIGISVGAQSVWVTNEIDASVSRIDPAIGRVQQRIGVGNAPGAVQATDTGVWVANTLDGTVSRIDPTRNAVVATVPVGDGPAGIAVSADGVWVANEGAGTVIRIDPSTNSVAERIETGQQPVGLAADGRRIWLAARDASRAHRGGTLRVVIDGLDMSLGVLEQFDYSTLWQINLTGDGLTAYRRSGGADGASVVPDLATSIPTPTDGGRTYTFQLRRGIRYSTGEVVQPSDIRRAIERLYRLGGADSPLYYDVIVGGAACRARPARCNLARGIVADAAANTVTVHLTRPDPNLVHVLALPFAHAVAPSAPASPATTRALPATGPTWWRASGRAARFASCATPSSASGRVRRGPTGIPTRSSSLRWATRGRLQRSRAVASTSSTGGSTRICSHGSPSSTRASFTPRRSPAPSSSR